MKNQSYDNHIRFYAPHHFIFYPISAGLIAVSSYMGYRSEDPLPWIFIVLIFVMITWLSYMLRQHYALTLQDRVIRLELHCRYYAMTGKRLENLHSPLRDSQLFALRFASDAEFLPLLERALEENLSGKKIKQAIKLWKADNDRV